jgi:hypothetical protein
MHYRRSSGTRPETGGAPQLYVRGIMRRLLLCLLLILISKPLLAESFSCPGNFEEFLQRFETDEEFKLTHVKYPLRYITPDRNHPLYPDSPRIERHYQFEHFRNTKAIIFPSKSEQEKMSLQKNIKTSSKNVIVSVNLHDSDAYSFEYHFSKTRTCWLLFMVQDYSL